MQGGASHERSSSKWMGLNCAVACRALLRRLQLHGSQPPSCPRQHEVGNLTTFCTPFCQVPKNINLKHYAKNPQPPFPSKYRKNSNIKNFWVGGGCRRGPKLFMLNSSCVLFAPRFGFRHQKMCPQEVVYMKLSSLTSESSYLERSSCFWRLPVTSLRGKRHRPDQSQLLRPPKVLLESTVCKKFPPPLSRDTPLPKVLSSSKA